jgi:hypothetical protein
MTINTVLLIVLSLGIAFAVSFYQYLYKAKSRSKVTLLLAFLRFFSVFALLILLINPIISRKTIETIKTPLPIVIDNSASMADLKSDKEALALFEKLKDNSALNERFKRTNLMPIFYLRIISISKGNNPI